MDEQNDEFYLDDQPDIKIKQENLNASHLFGTKPWKSALYKKARSITKVADDNVLGIDSPGSNIFREKFKWKNLVYLFIVGWWMGLIYGFISSILMLLSFGKSPYIPLTIKLMKYNFWPFRYRIERHLIGTMSTSDLEGDNVSLLYGHVITSTWDSMCYTILICLFAYPFHAFFWLLSYLSVYYIPIAKLSSKLMRNLLNQPLMLEISRLHESDPSRLLSNSDNLLQYSPQQGRDSGKMLLASIHIAADVKYFKYTVDGVNIIFINMIPVVLFTIFNGYYLAPQSDYKHGLNSRQSIFYLCLSSSIPLSYFLGLGVASISAQSSFGLAAIVNASFGSIIEILLYCIALTQKKGRIVEGSFIGSFLAVLVLLPGLSMVFGGLKYKELKFNAKSTGVTTTMLIMSIITIFTPTIFNMAYGQSKFGYFYFNYIRPLTWICIAVMPTAYVMGLIFTLKTHVKHIYEVGYTATVDHENRNETVIPQVTLTPTESDDGNTVDSDQNDQVLSVPQSRSRARSTSVSVHMDLHDAPNWSIPKSLAVIVICTVLFSFVAELLVDCVDVVLQGTQLSEKFIGVTLFALVPSVPEFVNAIAFALQGHVDLSLEIGLAYTVQVALLQIPCVVLFSTFNLFITEQKPTIYNSFP
eukprot:NODE_387_length_8274_cov_0.737125.p2 type:complete len:641 gc:universal NODE_387_length_8274_cov_0.737125:359-2281(+)